jgi:hypothetical protein
VATVTFVIEHLIKNDNDFDYDYFLRNVEDFYVEWKNENNSNGNEIEGDEENIYRNKYIRKLEVESEGKKEIKEFVTFEDFLLLNIWNEIVYPIRNNIKSIKSTKKLLDPDVFIENIKKQDLFIMFNSSVIVLDKAPELENYDLKKIPDYFIEDILEFLGGKNIKKKKDIIVKNYIEEIKENGFEVRGEIAYENYVCDIVRLNAYNMKDFYKI